MGVRRAGPAGIDTIDATDIDLTYLCHGYYAAARPVLTDMHLILRGNDQPQTASD